MSSTEVTPNKLDTAIEEAAADFPAAAALVKELVETAPTLMSSQIGLLIESRGIAFWHTAQRLASLANAMGGSPAHSIVEYTVSFLKEQVRFLKTGSYTHTDFDRAREAVYDNSEVMEKFYLEGLMLTHAFWAVHFDIHAFFVEQFLPRLPGEGVGAEFGFGHGLYLLEVLTAQKGGRAEGYDISEFSIKYASNLLRHGGVTPDRYSLRFGDVRNPLPAEDGEYRWAIFAEVLEHVPDPRFSLSEVSRCLAAEAPLFVTTAVNSNALDHLWLFETVEEVDEMVADVGLEVLARKVFPVADYGAVTRDPTINVAYICRRR